jgi:hypothetical protein
MPSLAGGRDRVPGHGLPRRGRGPVGDEQRKAVKQQVDGARRGRGRREGPGGAGDLKQVAGASQVPGEFRRVPRVEVGLTGEAKVKRLEPLGRLE